MERFIKHIESDSRFDLCVLCASVVKG